MLPKSLRLTILLTTALSPAASFAAPEGGSVAYGDADISQAGKVTNIAQHTDRAVLDWQKFNLAADETANFAQPSKSSIAINRIHDVDPSVIRGNLKANGTVVLSNANGVMFSSEATVDVGGLVASSAITSNQSARDFVEGRRNDVPLDVAGKSTASVVNAGTITVKDAGIAGFVAPQVENSGVIRATMGKVQLASGDTATVDLYGDGLINLAVSDSTEKQLVSNRGLIEADGGTVMLTAAAGEKVARGVITMDGVIQARSVAKKNGKIILSADGSVSVKNNITANKGKKSGGSAVSVSGTIDASGKNSGERGGSITVTGDKITLTKTARIDASGHTGKSNTVSKNNRSAMRDGSAGGDIKIGGDYLGQGETSTAQTLSVEQGAIISADAIGEGDAGRIILWSDGDTTFRGDVFARALGSSGNGGFLETSGKHNLTASGNVNLTSLYGETGLWLLDPTNITIYNRAYGGGTDNSNTFLTSYLEAQSISADIALNASNDITLDMTGDVLNFTTASRALTLTAGGQILTASTGGITTNGGAVTLNATGGINLAHTMPITTAGGAININNALTLGAAQTFNAGTGTITTASTVAAGANNFTLTADDLALGGNLSGTGTLTLQPLSTNRALNISNGVGAGTFSLDATEIGYFADGWAGINIGRTDTASADLTIGTSTWTDPVTFRSSFRMRTAGNIIGTGNASISFGGTSAGWLDLTNNNNITTAGQAVTFGNTLWNYGGTITTSGGNVNFADVVRIHSSAAANALTVNTSGGNISFSNTLLNHVSSAGKNISLNAGSGILSFANTVNGGFNLTGTAGSMTFNGAWGGTTALGNVSLTSTNTNFTMPTLTSTGNVDLNAGTGTITTGAISTGSGNLTLTADDLVIGGALTGTGTLTLQPNSTNRIVCINFSAGTCSSNNLALSTTELAYLTDGWLGINVGRTNGTVDINMGGTNWVDPINFYGGRKQILGALTGTGNASFAFLGGINTDIIGDITTAGGAVDFSAPGYVWVAGGARTINSNGGAVTFKHILTNSASSNLTVNSGAGNIGITNTIYTGASAAGQTLAFNSTGTINFGGTVNTLANITAAGASLMFNGAWGGTTALGNVSLTSTNTNFTMPTLTSTGNVDLNAGTGTITTGAISTGAGNLTLTADDLAIGGALSGTGILTLSPYSASRQLRINSGSADGTNFNLSTADIANLTDGWSSIRVGKNGGTNGGFIAASAWLDPLTIYSNSTTYLDGIVSTAGSNNITFQGGQYYVRDGGATTVGGNVTFSSNANFERGGTFTTNGGAMLFGAGVSISAYSLAPINITTAGGSVTFASTLASSLPVGAPVGKTLTVNAGSGAINFGSTVNGEYSLVTSGGSYSFNGAWGGTTGLGSLSLTSTSSFTMPTLTSTGNVLLNAGTGTITTGAISTGSGNLTLTADDVNIGGNITGTGALLMQPFTNSRTMNLAAGGTSGYFYMNAVDTQYLQNGWSSLTFGNSSMTGDINLGPLAWSSHLNLVTGSGNIGLINAASTLAANKSFTATANSGSINAYYTSGSLTTSGTGAISLTAGQDINFTQDFDLISASGDITLRANRNILYSASGDITTSGGAITLNSDRDATSGGAINLGNGTNLTSNSGAITLGGGANPLTTAAIGTASNPQGISLTSVVLDAGGGNMSLLGTGYALGTGNSYGLYMDASAVQTSGAGTITVTGTGAGTTTGDGRGVSIFNGSSIVTGAGALNVTGIGGGGASSTANIGVLLSSVGLNKIQSTTGNITVNGTGGMTAGSTTNNGIALNSSAGGILSAGGTVTLTGIQGVGASSFGISSSLGGTIGGASSGNVALIADTLSFSTVPTIQSASDVILRPYTAGTTVGVGSGAGTLAITDAILNNITPGGTGTIWLGGYGLDPLGAGYVNNAGNMTINTGRTASRHLNFLSGGNIVSGAANTLTMSGAASTVLYALGDINFSHDFDITASGTGSVTERANGNIIYTGGGDITTAGGAITLNSDRDGNSDGAINLSSGTALTSNGGNITLGGGASPTTSSAVGGASYLQGINITNSTIDARGAASGGSISLRGLGSASSTVSNPATSASGILLNGGIVQTNFAGVVDLVGTGGGTGVGQGRGIYFINSGLVTSQHGDITMTGTGGGGSSSTNNEGITFSSAGTNKVEATGTGNITAIGTGGSTIGSGGNIGIVNASSGTTSGFFTTTGTQSITGIRGITSGAGISTSGTLSTSNSGRIMWIADTIGASSAPITSTSGDIVIRPHTAGTTVGIGSGAGTLALSSSFLGALTTTGSLWLGGYGNPGDAGYVSNAGDMTINLTRSFANTINFMSGGNIVSGGAATLTFTNAANANLYALGDINFGHDLDITASGTGSVTERANGNIIYTGGGDITTSGGAITLNSDRDATSGGAINLGSGTNLTSNGGNIVLGGGATPSSVGAVGYSNTYKYGVSSSGIIDASGVSTNGNISIYGAAWADATCSNNCYGIILNGSITTGGSGTITFDGTGGGVGSTNHNHGIENRSAITSAAGDITLIGRVTETGGGGAGISMPSGSITTSAGGNVNLTEIYASANSGGFSPWGTSTINSSGNITLLTNKISSYNNHTWAATGDIIIRPYTAGTTMGIGAGAGALQVTDAFLSKLTVGNNLWLGGYGNPGDAGYISNAGNMTINLTRSFANNVNFMSAGNILTSGTGTVTTTGTGSILLAALGDINLSTAQNFTASGTGSITEHANGNIVHSGGGTVTTQGGAITLNSDRDGNSDGAIALTNASNISSNGGAITLGGGTAPATTHAFGNSTYAQGILVSDSTINGGTNGNVSLYGRGHVMGTISDATIAQHGVFLFGGTLQTGGTGTMTVNGVGGGTGVGSGMGVFVRNGSTISAANGAVDVRGFGGGGTSSSFNTGVALSSLGTNIIQSTGGANLSVQGTGGAAVGSTENSGVVLNSGTGGILKSGSGSLTLYGFSNIVGSDGIRGDNSGTIGGASATGNFDIASNAVLFTTAPVIQTTGQVTLRTTSGTSIGVAGGAGILQLNSAILNAISAGTIQVGSASHNNLITANAYNWAPNVSFVAGTAHIVLNGMQTVAANKNFSASTTSGSGNIFIGTGGGVTTSGTGTINLTANNSITTSGAGSLTSASGNIGLTATGGIALSHALPITSTSGNISFNSPLTSTAAQTFNAGTGTITTGSMSMAANNLTLTADDVAIGGNLSGTGTLTLQPSSTSRQLRIATGSSNGTNLNLTAAEMDYLTDGWGQINIGRSDSSSNMIMGAFTLKDPTSFATNGANAIYMDGAIIGTGNASTNFVSRAIFRDGSITTNGGGVTFGTSVFSETAGAITTNGGAVNIGSFIGMRATTLAAFGITTGGGNISIGTGIYTDSGGSAAGKALNLNAGAGTINFGGSSYYDPYDLVASAGSFTFSGAWGGSSRPLGDVTLTSTNNISLPSITTVAGKTVNVTVTGSGNSITTTSAIATGAAGNISLTADDLTLGGNLSGTGTLTLQPNSTSRIVCVNSTASTCATPVSTFNLSTSEIGNFNDGWGLIQVGRTSGGSGAAFVNTSAWLDPLAIYSNGGLWLDGIISTTGSNNISFLGSTTNYFVRDGGVTTAGGNISFNGTTVFERGGTFSTGGGSYTSGGIIMGGYSLGTVGISTAGGALTVGGISSNTSPSAPVGKLLSLDAGAGLLTFGGTVNGVHDITTNAGSYAFNGAWGATTPLRNVSLTSANTSFTMPTLTTTGNVDLNAGTGTITTGAISTGSGNLSITSDDVAIGGNLSGTGTLILQPSSIARGVTINYGGGNFNLSTAELGYLVDGWSQINLGNTASTGWVSIGTSAWKDPLTLRSNGRQYVFGDMASIAPISFSAGDYALMWGGSITTQNQAVTSGGTFYTYGADNAITTNGGALSLNNLTIDMASGSNPLTVNTSGGTITIGQLSSSYSQTGKTVTLDAGSGAINFGGTVNGNNNFILNAGSMTFNGAWGAGTPLGDVSLTSVSGISLPAITTAAGRTISALVTGAGNAITTLGALATGTAGNISLTADDLTLGGNLSGTGTLTLQPNSTSRGVRVNFGSADGSNLHLSTTELGYLVDGWSGITIGRSDSTALTELNTSTWRDPVTFHGSSKRIWDAITGTGNASILFGTSATSGTNEFTTATSSITTAGQNVTFNDYARTAGAGGAGAITTNGGNVSFGSTGGESLRINASPLTVNTSGGNIGFSGYIRDLSGSATGIALTLNAGAGNISYGDTVNGAFNLTANAGSYSFNGAFGGTTPLGAVSLTSTNALALPSITASSILAQTTGATSDITLGNGNILSASGSGNAITLASGRNVINNAGSGALALTGAGRWLVYSANPTDTVGEENLSNNFNRYSCTYSSAGACAGGSVLVPTSGNGLLYSYTPTLTATATGQTIAYGDAVPALSNYGYSVSGYLGSDASADSLSGSLTGSTDYTQGSNIGNYAINYSSGALASAMGYGFTYANAASALTVNPRTLTATLIGATSKEYDRTLAAILSGSNYSLSNVYGSDDVVLNNPTSGTYDNVHAGTGKTISVSGLGISGTKASNYTLAASSISGAIGEITAKALSVLGVTANNKVYDKTTTATLNVSSASLSGVIIGDTISLSGTGVGAFADKNVADGKAVTVSGLTLAGSNPGDYTITQPTGLTANITPKSATANMVGSITKTYDGTMDATLDSGNYSLSSILSGDVVSLNYPSSGTYNDKNVGSGKTVSVSGLSLLGTDAGNYTLTATSLSGNIGAITPKDLAVFVDSGQSKTYGDADGALTYYYTGLASGDSLASFIGSLSRSVGEDAGDYTISQGSLTGSGNYTIGSFTDGTYRINKAAITIAAPTLSRTYGDANPTLSWSNASITGLKNSETGAVLDTLTFNLAAGATTTANAGTSYATSVNSFSDNNYTLSSSSNGLLTITQRDITAAWNASLSKVYGNANPTVTTGNFTYSGLINGADNSVITATPDFGSVNANSNVGTYAVGASFSSTNYHVSNAPATLLQITPRPLTITTYDAIRSYGDSNAGLTGAVSGLTVYDDAQIGWNYTPTTTARNVGTYTIGATATDNANRLSNYTRTNNYGTLTINPVLLYVSANNGAKTYGDSDAALGYSFSNLKHDDTASIFMGALQRAAGENVGNYAIGQGTLGANTNYVISFTSGQYSINPATLNIAANNASRLFGYQNPDLGVTITGWKMGDTPSVLSGLKLHTDAVLSSNIGSYRIWASDAVAANYTMNYRDGVMQVVPASNILPSTVERITSLSPYQLRIEDKEFIDFKKPYADTVGFDKFDFHYTGEDISSNQSEIRDNHLSIEFSDSMTGNLPNNTEAL